MAPVPGGRPKEKERRKSGNTDKTVQVPEVFVGSHGETAVGGVCQDHLPVLDLAGAGVHPVHVHEHHAGV